MRLIKNARAVALRAFSMWCNYLGILALIAPELIFYTTGRDTNPHLWWWLGLALIVAGIVGRLLDQGGLDGDPSTRWTSPIAVIAALALMGQWGQAVDSTPAIPADPPVVQLVGPPSDAAFLAVAVPLVGKWEGLRLEPYRDIVNVLTWCYGETQGTPKASYTKAECDAMLGKRILQYRAGMHKRYTPETLARRLTAQRDAALSSVAYNVGVAGFGGSTSVKRLNAGDIAGSCEALTWWNKAGGRVVRGLVNRRAEEYDLCMFGVRG
ncbi:lysozyme [Sagittula sp. S175]|uniref:lysozyme n=1 Tax=Sagittula sp. S175 TaxID=3415129 RepID=UPI003C7BE349